MQNRNYEVCLNSKGKKVCKKRYFDFNEALEYYFYLCAEHGMNYDNGMASPEGTPEAGHVAVDLCTPINGSKYRITLINYECSVICLETGLEEFLGSEKECLKFASEQDYPCSVYRLGINDFGIIHTFLI